jgi:phosphodiesterase/alkaline phosphatase D-like protein
MFVEVSPTETFRRVRRVAGPVLDAASNFTGKTLLRGLPAGEDVFYRVVVADLDDDRLTGAPAYGRLRPVRSASGSCGRPTSPARAGASMRPAADTASSTPCAG